ncbi:MAG: RluA family pseudouridine synthase [Burkholderiales bacterium]|nr:RluA family pseudouridine synthase [Burkholderiales bacterium]MDE2277597.1 RluA family pseudouridine synthase [Burkholderiales bacterium]
MLPALPIDELEVLHADAALVVVVKPAGLLAVPGRGDEGAHHLAGRVQAAYPDARVVHRLDMATSGLMVFARGAAAHRLLSAAFAERRVAKHYVAVVEGQLAGESGEIAAPLAADWPNRPRQVVDALHGKPSLTRWRVLARAADATRLALEPLTGRTHQLRVHLQSVGHPIRGDALYAPPPLRAPRLLLHAARLALTHPLQGTALAFESPPPF